MNIAEMMVAVGVNPSGVSKGLNQAGKLFGGFQRDVSRAFSTKDLISASAVEKQGAVAARSLVDALTSTFQSEAVKAREALVAGVSSAEEFRAAGDRAAEAYNSGLRGGLQDLRDVGLATGAISGQLSDSFKATGSSAATSFWAAATAGLVARRALPPLINPRELADQGRDGAVALLQSFSAGVRSGRADVGALLGSGLVDQSRLLGAGQQGGVALVQGVRSGVVQTAGAGGVIPPAVVATIADQFGDAGRKGGAQAADAFAEEIRNREEKFRKTGQFLSSLGTGLSVAITAPLVAGAVAATKFQVDFEKSFAAVTKTTGLAGEDLVRFQKQLKGLSEQPGFGSATGLAGIAALGGQLGITNDQLLEFTKTVKQFDLAAETLSAEEAATGLARLQTIMGGTADDFSRTASAISAIADAGSATERDIVDLALRIAGVGASFKLSKADVVGFSAAIAGLGINAEAGGTAFQRLFLDISKAARGGGADLNNLATVAGKSAGEFKRLFQTDAREAVLQFIEGLGRVKKAGGDVGRVLGALKFDDQRSITLLLSAAGAAETFRDSVDQTGRSFTDNKRIAEEFARGSGVLGEQLSAVAEQARNIAQEFGAGLAPVLRDTLQVVGDLLSPVRALGVYFGELPKPVRTTIAAVLGLAAVLGPTLLVLGKVAQSLVFLRTVSWVTAGAGGLGAIGAALAAGAPILVGLAAGAAALYLFGKSARDTAADVATFRTELAGSTQDELINIGAGIQAKIDDLEATRAILERAQIGVVTDATAVAGMSAMANPGETAARIKLINDQLTALHARQAAAVDLFNQQAKAEDDAARAGKRMADELQAAFGDLGFDTSKSQTALEKLGQKVQENIVSLRALGETAGQIDKGILSGDPVKVSIDTSDTLLRLKGLSTEVSAQIQADLAKGVTPPKELSQLQVAIAEAFAAFTKGAPEMSAALGRAAAKAAGLTGDFQKFFADVLRKDFQVQITAVLRPGTFEQDTKALAARVAKQLGRDEASQIKLTASIDTQFETLASTVDKTLTPAAAEFYKWMEKAGIETQTLDEQAAGMAASLGKINTIQAAAQDATYLAEQFGLIKGDSAEAVQNVIDLGAGIARIAAGDILGGIMQGISGLGGLLGLGESPEEKEAKQIAKQNVAALNRLSDEIGNIDINITGDTFSKLEDVFATITDPSKFLLKDNTNLGNRVNSLLQTEGLSIDDVKAAAAELGLTFRNTAEFYRTFALALKEVELTTFTDTFTGALDKLNKEFEIFGITDPTEKLQKLLGIITDPSGNIGSPKLAELFNGLDLTTEAGLTDLQARIEQAFNEFQSMSPEELGGLDPSQFLDALAEAAGLSREALEELTGATEEAIGSMTNVPSGFKRAATEWAATLPETVGMKPVDGPLANVELTPINSELITRLDGMADTFATTQLETTGALQPLEPMLAVLERMQSTTAPDLLDSLAQVRDAVKQMRDGTATTQQPTAGMRPHTGPLVEINVHPLPGQNPTEIAQATLSEFQRLGMRHVGNTLVYVGG